MANICEFENPLVSLLVLVLPLFVEESLTEVVSVEEDWCRNEVCEVRCDRLIEGFFVEEVLVLFHKENQDGGCRTNESNILFLKLRLRVELVIKVVIIDVCDFGVSIITKCFSLRLI